MRDNISILIKRAKNYKDSADELITKVSSFILEYGEMLYLDDLGYLIMGDGQIFENIEDAKRVINATELKDGLVREVIVNTGKYYVGGTSVNELIKNHKYFSGVNDIILYGNALYDAEIEEDADDKTIANIGYVKDTALKIVENYVKGRTYTPTGDPSVSNTVTKFEYDDGNIKIEFQPISISYDQIYDGDTYKRPLPSDDTPSAVGGTASAGTSTKYSRADHVHKITAAGSSSKPIYIDSTGTPKECGDLNVNITGSSASCTGNAARVNSTYGNTFNVAGVKSANGDLYYNTSVTVSNKNVLMGAAWNDFAEFRKCNEDYGTVVCEVGDGTLEKSREKLQPGAYVVSDTCGMVIGPQSKGYKPVAVAGRVLVNYYGDIKNYKIGMPVCAGPNGLIYPMKSREVYKHPESIVGYVSEIPNYNKWNDVEINNRI